MSGQWLQEERMCVWQARRCFLIVKFGSQYHDVAKKKKKKEGRTNLKSFCYTELLVF